MELSAFSGHPFKNPQSKMTKDKLDQSEFFMVLQENSTKWGTLFTRIRGSTMGGVGV